MSLVPDQQDAALEQALHHIDMALGYLAQWTPHGGDSSRVADYYASKTAQIRLDEAKTELSAARNLPNIIRRLFPDEHH